MQFKGIQYAFNAKIWLYTVPGGWHFVSLPVEMSNDKNIKILIWI
jgi:hypothetical protein